MDAINRDQTHLIALVALLISIAGFKDELKHAEINSTGVTLYDIFLYATVAFGVILFLLLVLNQIYLFRSALSEKKKAWSLIFLRGSILLILSSIPLSVGYVASSNWLHSEVCSYYEETDAFGSVINNSKGSRQQICTTPLIGTVLPLAGGALITLLVFATVARKEREYNRLPEKAKYLSSQIAEYRIMQAVTNDLQRINELQKLIDNLKDQYFKIIKESDEIEQEESHQ